MDVSIIIVNYNTTALLQACVESIIQLTTGVSYEIIVVDNASREEEVAPLRHDDRFILIEASGNLGFGRANNLGLTRTKGKYIFFLNSDTILLNNAVKMFCDFAEAHGSSIAAIGGILENRKGELVHSYGHFPHIANTLWNILLLIPIKKAMHLYKEPMPVWPDEYREVEYITGADLFVPKSILDQCGAFDPAFFMYYEETEMQHRFLLAGYKNILLRGPRIIHLEGESAKKNGASKFLRDTLRQERSLFIYFRLTEPRWKYIMFRILYPTFRQTLWINPKVSFADKCKVMKNLIK